MFEIGDLVRYKYRHAIRKFTDLTDGAIYVVLDTTARTVTRNIRILIINDFGRQMWYNGYHFDLVN